MKWEKMTFSSISSPLDCGQGKTGAAGYLEGIKEAGIFLPGVGNLVKDAQFVPIHGHRKFPAKNGPPIRSGACEVAE